MQFIVDALDLGLGLEPSAINTIARGVRSKR